MLPLVGDAYKNTILNLGGDLNNPFVIFPEVAELYARRAQELEGIVAKRYAAKATWAQANPELAGKDGNVLCRQSSRSKLGGYRTEGKRRYPCRIGYRTGCIGHTGREHDRLFCRPFKLRQNETVS